MTTRLRGRAAVLVLTALALLTGGAVVRAAVTQPDFALRTLSAPIGVLQGNRGTVAVTLTPSGGFTGTVAYSVSGLPAGVTGTFAPAPTAVAGPQAKTVTLTLAATVKAKGGEYVARITGTSGKLSRSTTATFTVRIAGSAGFVLGAAPATRTVDAGVAASHTITLARSGGFTGALTLTAEGLPAGTSASFSPRILSGGQTTSTLTLATSATTPTGTYSYAVRAAGGGLARTVPIGLTVTTSASFSVSGAVAGLRPGRSAALDLALRNPLNQALNVTSLTVAVDGSTSRPGCSGSTNFRVTPYSGALPLVVPANTTRTLAQLGVPAARRPQIGMLDLSTNQDACKQAALTLHFGGSATK